MKNLHWKGQKPNQIGENEENDDEEKAEQERTSFVFHRSLILSFRGLFFQKIVIGDSSWVSRTLG